MLALALFFSLSPSLPPQAHDKCVGVSVCLCVYYAVYVWASVYKSGARQDIHYVSPLLSAHCLETQKLTVSAKLIQDPPVSTSQHWGQRLMWLCPAFSQGPGVQTQDLLLADLMLAQ